MTKKQLQIHSQNILPIIKKWLYSDKDTFIRELISNSCDAISKRKLLADQGKGVFSAENARIDISVNKEANTLVFQDTGLGMTQEEVDKYIAKIAFSGAEEFVEKYLSGNSGDQIIGHFGLGFYSSFMVASKVTISTKSWDLTQKAAFWECDGSSEYELSEGKKEDTGTEITLYVMEEEKEFLEEATLRAILEKYCSFLPYPIYLNGKRINEQEPLWIKPASMCTEEEYKTFFRSLYPVDPEPLFWIHLNVDYPFHLKGILYFPKIERSFDPQKSSVQLYCNRVFVSDNCKDLLPRYLTVLKGVIDSPDIPLNVSRSHLQVDRTVRQVAKHVVKKVSDSLHTLYNTDKERFLSGWEDIGLILKLGAVEDESFYEKVKDLFIWKTTKGNWVTTQEYLERNTKKEKVLLYTKLGAEKAGITKLWEDKGFEVIVSSSPLDSHLMQLIEKKESGMSFKRVDSELDSSLFDEEREKKVLNSEGKTEADTLALLIKTLMDQDDLDIEAKSLSDNSVPGLIVIDESSRRMKEMFEQFGGAEIALPGSKKTFIVNTNNPIVEKIPSFERTCPELAKKLTRQLYQLALVHQKELSAHTLDELVLSTTEVLSELVQRIPKSS